MDKLTAIILTGASGLDWSTVKVDGIFTDVKTALPVIAPVVIGFIGLRKAWGFIVSNLRRA